jgi:hypothetical protein
VGWYATVACRVIPHDTNQAKIYDTSPKTVRSLSTVNRGCYHVALPFIYRNFTIKVSDRESLRRDVAKLTENDHSQKHLMYLRRLKLKGQMPLLDEHTGNELPHVINMLDERYERDETSSENNTKPQFNAVFVTDRKEAGADESSRAWSPLISLISSLSHLTDLTYGCDNQVPPCLLHALHRHHPTCRLDIRTFRLRSLREPITDPNELALVTSPCLHSLSVRYVRRDSHGYDDYNEEAVMRAVTIAPNLKHVNMLGCRPADSPRLHFSRKRARVPWKGFVPPLETFQIGSLTSLAFCGYQHITKKKLHKWSQHTDLSKIQSLIVTSLSDATALMEDAGDTPFKSLKQLNIHLARERNDLTFSAGVEALFNSLNPLTALRLSGSLDPWLMLEILKRHGSTLQELVVDLYETDSNLPRAMILTRADILNIRDRCPLLHALQLSIKRFKSDWRETQCYEAFGTFPSLTKLSLHLDCSNPPSRDALDPDGDDFDRELYTSGLSPPLYNAHIRDALINSAVDESLSRSIWDLVSTNKPGCPLASLRITSGGGGSFGNLYPGPIRNQISHMSRSFLHTRSESNDSDHVDVVEVSKPGREQADKRERERELEAGGKPSENVTRIFERLWPPKAGSLDWRDDWCSRPLEKRQPHLG